MTRPHDPQGDRFVPSELLVRRDGITILQPKIFSQRSEIVCAVSTKLNAHHLSPSGMNISYKVGDDPSVVRRNREAFFSVLMIDERDLAIPSQVHGDRIEQVDHPGKFDGCDAMITDKEGVVLSVTIADCVPVILYDPAAKLVAAVHSGWRGCQVKVLEKTMERLETSYHSRPENLLAYIGPSAGACCYEVGEEVAREFSAEYLSGTHTQPHLDLRAINRDVLLRRGVPPANLEISKYCTICNPGLFHSHRRDGKASGRMMAVIGRRPPPVMGDT